VTQTLGGGPAKKTSVKRPLVVVGVWYD
jgi:hypothetical protein